MDDRLAEFIETSFGSVWSLETLLFLRRERDRSWTGEELVQQLRSSDAVVAEAVDRLVVSGLLVADEAGALRYAPASPDLEALCGRLEDEYRKAPTAIRRMIVQTPLGKLRSFADAFKVIKP
jgi:hypothetical protein